MESSHKTIPAHQHFLIVEYISGTDGQMVPREIPNVAPCQRHGDPCRVGVHARRHRKTGPCHPLVVIRCKTHERCFTLYPPEYVPYGRKRVAPVGGDGRPEAASLNADHWRETLFGAAIEAASRETPLWPRDPSAGQLSLRTQRRWVERAAIWLGVLGDRRLSERTAHLLSIDLHVHVQARATYRTAQGTRGRAQAVACVLDALPVDASMLHRVLRAGCLAGVCPRPWWWRENRYAQVFRGVEPTACEAHG